MKCFIPIVAALSVISCSPTNLNDAQVVNHEAAVFNNSFNDNEKFFGDSVKATFLYQTDKYKFSIDDLLAMLTKDIATISPAGQDFADELVKEIRASSDLQDVFNAATIQAKIDAHLAAVASFFKGEFTDKANDLATRLGQSQESRLVCWKQTRDSFKSSIDSMIEQARTSVDSIILYTSIGVESEFTTARSVINNLRYESSNCLDPVCNLERVSSCYWNKKML